MSRNGDETSPDWSAPDPWAPTEPPVRPFDWLPPLGHDGFRRDALARPLDHLTTTEVCKKLEITYRQANHWVRRGWIPGLTGNDQRGGSGAGRWWWSPVQVETARRVRDHLDQIRALEADLGTCGPHCQHEDGS
jgi:hypothetical protein